MTNRRVLLKQGLASGAGVASLNLTASSARAVAGANERVTLAIMGVNGRGRDLALSFAQTGGADIAYLSDVDERAIAKCTEALSKHQIKTPQGVRDFRKALEDPAVDARVIAAPNHWHGPATIIGCFFTECDTPSEQSLDMNTMVLSSRLPPIGSVLALSAWSSSLKRCIW